MLQRIPIQFTVLFMGTLFFYNPLYGQCGSGYVEIDEECYWKKDIFFLQGFIDGSKDFLDIDMDDNEDGIISPLELGVQTWSGEGRLTSLFCSNRGLTGDIPEEIINLDKLYWLLLSDNQITGAIPKDIGNLVNLIKLDLQWNEIEAKVQDHLLDNSAKGRHQGASHQGTGGGGKQSTQGGGAGGTINILFSRLKAV